MKKFRIYSSAVLAAMLLLAAVSCSPNQTKNEKVKVLEYQGYVVNRQMGINDVYDTTHSYKTINIKDSTTFILKTNDRLSVDDIVNVGCTCR